MGKLELIPRLRFPNFKDNWDILKIKEFAEIKTGDKDTQNKVDGGLYPFFVRSDNVEKINSYTYDGEAILTSGDGVGVGKNFHYINGKFDFHQRVYSIRNFTENVNAKFFYFVFSERFFNRVSRLSAKNSVDSVRMDMIADMDISIPSISEQQKIASFLTDVDSKLQALKKKKELLEQYKKGVMQKIFSQELRFKDKDGKDYPEWNDTQLDKISTRVVNKNKEDNQNVLTISAQYGLISQLDFFNKSVSAKDLKGYYLLEKGDFAYNKSYSNGYPMGAIKCLNQYPKGVVSTLYICFRFNNKVNTNFMENYFDFGLQNTELKKIAQEGARNHGLLNIGVADFFSIKVTLPSIKEQNKISDFLSKLDIIIDSVNRITEDTVKWKKGLLQKLFV